MSANAVPIVGFEVQFSADEAVTLLRAIAVAKQKAAGMDDFDDLELLRQRIYHRMYRDGHDSLPKPAARIYSSAGRIQVCTDEESAAA
jgi:hypothetical protein